MLGLGDVGVIRIVDRLCEKNENFTFCEAICSGSDLHLKVRILQSHPKHVEPHQRVVVHFGISIVKYR